MPIVEITTLPPEGSLDVAAALSRVTTAVASYLGEDPRGTWALWRPVGAGAYAEGADAPATQPRSTHPPIVDVFAGRRDDPEELMAVVGRAVLEAFGLEDGNVVVRPRGADDAHVWWGQ